MQTLQEITPPTATAAVKACDEKLAPLLQRQTALENQVAKHLTTLNPYTEGPTSNARAVVEARLSLPQAQADLARMGLDISDLNRQRDEAVRDAQRQVEAELDRQIVEECEQMRRDFEAYIRPRNRRIHELEERKESFTATVVVDRFAWWDLLDETPTVETRWGLWTRGIDAAKKRLGM